MRIDPSAYFPLKMGEPARFMLVEGYGKSPTSTVELDLWLFQLYIPTMIRRTCNYQYTHGKLKDTA